MAESLPKSGAVVPLHRQTLLDAVTANSTAEVEAPGSLFSYQRHLFYVEAASVSSGATFKIQAKTFGGNWFDLHSEVVNANGAFTVPVDGGWPELRVEIASRIDGTFTVSCDSVS